MGDISHNTVPIKSSGQPMRPIGLWPMIFWPRGEGWPVSKCKPDIPWYVHKVPTLFVSVACPFHLADVPQVKCYNNTCDDRETTL